MELDTIIQQVNTICMELFEDEGIVPMEESDVPTVYEWDSLNHIQIITAVEKHFNIRFELNELLNFQNMGDLCWGVKNKLS